MRTDIIQVDNQGNGFAEIMDQATRAAEYCRLERQDTLHLQIMTEELLSLVKSVTGSMKSAIWIETDHGKIELHLTTRSKLSREKRDQLIKSASSGKNEAAGTFLGMLRNFLEQATANNAPDVSDDVLNKLLSHQVVPEDAFQNPEGSVDIPKWDGYEKSILQHVADNVRITVRGELVDIMVAISFA